MATSDIKLQKTQPEADPEPFNAGDPVHVGKRKEKGKRIRSQQLDDLRSILATKSGRRWLWRWLGECRVFQDSFTTNALAMSNMEGMRKIGLMLLAEIKEADQNAFILMQQENTANEENTNV